MSHSSDSSQGKTWGNGRTLSPKQVERKRAEDRVSKQKKRREVLKLQESLTGRVSELEAEIIDLKTKCGNDGLFAKVGSPPSWESYATAGSLGILPEGSKNVQFMNQDFDMGIVNEDCPIVHSAAITKIDPSPGLELNGLHTTVLFNQMIALAESSLSGQYVVQDNDVTDDFLIKAIMRGWNSAFHEYRLNQCYLWGLLEKVDQALYKDCSCISRMAHLRKIHRMFMFILFRKQLPEWYNASQIQHENPHDPIINFIAQPRLRDHLVLSQVNKKPAILTNQFWELYTRCVQFDYPLVDLAAFEDGETHGFLRFTKPFTDCFEREASWKLGAEIFAQFPDFIDDGTLAKSMRWPLSVERVHGYGQLKVNTTTSLKEQSQVYSGKTEAEDVDFNDL